MNRHPARRQPLLMASMLFAALTLPAIAEEGLEVPFTMPIPEGWRTETLAMPLEFAPKLAYEGLEELRFAPGMFEEKSEGFWTYAFVWWIPTDVELDAESLATDLETYFRGLATSVGKKSGANLSRAIFDADFRELASPRADRRKFDGEVTTFDAFTTKLNVHLNVEIEIRKCAGQQRQAVYFALSPQSTSHEIWKKLDSIRKGFACSSS